MQLPSLFKRANRSQTRSHHASIASIASAIPPSYPYGKRIALPVDAPFLHVRFPSLGTSVHLHQRLKEQREISETRIETQLFSCNQHAIKEPHGFHFFCGRGDGFQSH